MKKILFILFFISTFSFADTVKVLFIGNSYTYAHDLPTLFKNLSTSGGKIVYSDISAPGGYTFQMHLSDATTLNLISKGIWDYVILQEQSQTPVIEYLRYNSMYPSARKLDSIIKIHNPTAHTVFYMTWGRKNGGQQCIDTSCSPAFINFFHMQDSLKSSYTMISNMLSATLSPAGEAWRTARLIKPYVNLWDSDDSHPTLEGSYLTACVFYAKIFNQSPVGLSYYGGLPDTSALFYQQCARQTIGINSISSSLPEKFELFQNYPNPFNGSTIIKFSLPEQTFVMLKIYDVLGREIEALVNEKKNPGIYELPFSNNKISSGIYFYKISTQSFTSTKKLIILK